MSFAPHYIEILQAMALSHERTYSARPLWERVEELKNDMKEVGKLIQTKMLDLPVEIETIEQFDRYKVRANVMGYHLAVRNWAYHHQMKRIVEDMAVKVQKEFYRVYNVNCVEFVRLLFILSDAIEYRVNTYLRSVYSSLQYTDHIELQTSYSKNCLSKHEDLAGMERMWSLAGKDIDNLRALLLAHSDLQLQNLFTFSISEMLVLCEGKIDRDALVCLFDRMSFEFGELNELDQSSFILDNPVHERPFIKIESGKYFSSLWTSLNHLVLSILENLVSQDDRLRGKYEEQRARYLENEVELLFRKAFPTAQLFRGSKWKHTDGELYENDLIVVIDSFAIVVEAKSANVSKSAKRGAPNRLSKKLRELVEEPSEQSVRFIKYLQANKQQHDFETARGITNHVDISAVNYFIPLGVTFYHLGVVGTNLKLLVSAGLTNRPIDELAPSISLTDLEIVFEILDLPAQKIHYLQRRREFETQVSYNADELDLLGFYLDTGFNIGDYDNEQNVMLELTLKSKVLDPYFVPDNKGVKSSKPVLKMTKWWNDILCRLTNVQSSRWLEFSYVLLNMNIGRQKDLEEEFKALVSRIREKKVEHRHNWVSFRTAKEDRRYIIVAYPYLEEHRPKRDEMTSTILSSELEANPNAKGIVVIGVNIDRLHYPYSFLAGHLSTELFDNKFNSMSAFR